MSTLTTLSPSDMSAATTSEPIEEHVQRLLKDIEAAPVEVQVALFAKLLAGLATKINGSIATAMLKGAQTTSTPTKKKTPAKLTPLYEASLTELQDSSDPLEAWHHFGGAENLRRILPYQPQALLERMLRNPRMPEGDPPRPRASRENVAKNIIERLEHHFQNQ